MHVEVVARNPAEGNDVGLTHRAPVGQQRVADLQVFEVAPEWVQRRVVDLRTAHVLTGHRGQHGRGTLHRCPLQIVPNSPHATQLFASTGPTRATVLELWERRAVTGGFDGSLAVQYEQTAV